MKLSKSPLLGDVVLLVARELEPGPVEGLSHMLLVLQVGADIHKDLAGVDTGHFTLGLSKGNTHTCLEPRLGPACQLWMSTRKGCLQGPLGQPAQTTGHTHYGGGCCLQPLPTGFPGGEEHRAGKAVYFYKTLPVQAILMEISYTTQRCCTFACWDILYFFSFLT